MRGVLVTLPVTDRPRWGRQGREAGSFTYTPVTDSRRWGRQGWGRGVPSPGRPVRFPFDVRFGRGGGGGGRGGTRWNKDLKEQR